MSDDVIGTRQKEVGERLRQYRTRKNMTQEKFCDCTGITQSRYSLIENGREGLSFSTLIRIIDCFDDLSLDFLFRNSVENEEFNELQQVFSLIVKNCPREKYKYITAALTHMSQIVSL